MASKHSIGKNPTFPNQPPSQELKDSEATSKRSFKLPPYYIALEHIRRYHSEFPPQTIPDLTYTSSLDSSTQKWDSSSNEEIWGVTLEEALYRIPNIKVDQLRHRTQAYLKSIGKILIVYQIPRSRASQRRTQPYSEDETLISNIDDLIIDTISEIRQPISTIAHFETSEVTKFRNLFDFPEGNPILFNFLETQVGGPRPPKPPNTNPPVTSIPPPQPNFVINFIIGGNMVANQPWITINVLGIPGSQNALPKSLEKLLPKFDPDKDVLPEDHIKQFMLALRLMNVEYEDVVYKLFMYIFQGKESTWFFNLAPRSITSWKQFEIAFMT